MISVSGFLIYINKDGFPFQRTLMQLPILRSEQNTGNRTRLRFVLCTNLWSSRRPAQRLADVHRTSAYNGFESAFLNHKKGHPKGCPFLSEAHCCSCLYSGRNKTQATGLDCGLCFAQTYGAAAVQHGGWQMSTGHLHIMGSSPLS